MYRKKCSEHELYQHQFLHETQQNYPNLMIVTKVSEYDQEIPQSHTADQATAP